MWRNKPYTPSVIQKHTSGVDLGRSRLHGELQREDEKQAGRPGRLPAP